jgi:myo-inositol-1(or 4)-monophosphatase
MSNAITDPVFLQLISSVRDAGALLMSMWPKRHGPTTLLAVNQKIDGSLVSAADMASNEVLTKALHTLYPHDFVFSEEVACEPAVVQASKRTWIIDPLDGTSAFLEGRDDFSVLVGLSVDHHADAGILYLPARDQLFIAQAGKGAFRNDERIRVSEVTQARDHRVYVRRFESTAPHLESPMMDSGLALAKVASGELDGAIIKMVTHREWDIAAPMAILQEAGATVTDEKGRAIPTGTGSIGFTYFVASNTHTHKQLLNIIPS